ncbi:MAG: nucleotidyltransferase family protein [Candidatus Diapherotrites archaeon]|nr:nucleotidyltransferase family protein [Candidatus Diapherotrites archaeon]
MKVIIPAAGYAVRLYPLTKNKPKALLKIKDKPILEHIVCKLEELQDISEIWIVCNAKFFPVFKHWLSAFYSSIPIYLLNDETTSNETRLGQIGDIALAINQNKMNEDLLVVAGDNLFNFSLKPAYDFFKKNNVIVNTFHECGSKELAAQLGTGVLNSGHKVLEFEEKSQNPKSTLASHGIYFIPKNKISLIEEYVHQKGKQGPDLDKMGYFMNWLVEKHLLYGFVYSDKWFDIGWKESLRQTEQEFVCRC